MMRILPLIAVLGLVAMPALEAEAQVRRSLRVIGPNIHSLSVGQTQKALQAAKHKSPRKAGEKAARTGEECGRGVAEKKPPASKENQKPITRQSESYFLRKEIGAIPRAVCLPDWLDAGSNHLCK